MLVNSDFDSVVSAIREEDPRFSRGAYHFVQQGLDHTIKSLKDKERESNHVSGQELLEGMRDYALDQYGPMAFTLLQHWGVTRCEDFGDIVFNLVEKKVLGKTEHDSKADFAGGYDFREAFLDPFLPSGNN